MGEVSKLGLKQGLLQGCMGVTGMLCECLRLADEKRRAP